jgi:hypothetical protein
VERFTAASVSAQALCEKDMKLADVITARSCSCIFALTPRLTTSTVKTLEFELRVPLDLMSERIVSVVSASVNLKLANLLL